MLLHEFMSERREEILTSCLEELGISKTDSSIQGYMAQFFDEIVRAIKRDFGIRESESPLPGASETAARFGADQQRAGVPVTQVYPLFAAISQALGKTGEKYDLTISAEEYKLLNSCLDAGVATSIENFWRREKTDITERFGFLAHELRNALGNTSMAYKLLRAAGLDIKGRTADILGRNLLRMEALVAQCLASVQLTVGVHPKLIPIHVATVLRDLEASFIPDRGISIQLELDEQLYIAADETLLTSAVSNLIHNAIKFSREDTTIALSVRSSENSGLIEVADSCGGLRHENSAELFEPYVTHREGNPKGTGLGLAITKSAVEAMGGELNVFDRPGEGCVFWVRFPLLTS